MLVNVRADEKMVVMKLVNLADFFLFNDDSFNVMYYIFYITFFLKKHNQILKKKTKKKKQLKLINKLII